MAGGGWSFGAYGDPLEAQPTGLFLRWLCVSQPAAGIESAVPIGTIMADRLMYLPVAGLVAAVIAVESLPSSRLRYRLASLIATGFAVRTWMRDPDWTDDKTMAMASVQSSPGSFKVHQLMAAKLLGRGAQDWMGLWPSRSERGDPGAGAGRTEFAGDLESCGDVPSREGAGFQETTRARSMRRR